MLYRALAMTAGFTAVVALIISIVEPASDTYDTGILHLVLSLILWDRSEK